MLSVDEIHEVHMSHWEKGYGSISSKEAYFVQEVVYSCRPVDFLEIGTASGISTGFIAKFMDACQGVRLVSIDLDDLLQGEGHVTVVVEPDSRSAISSVSRTKDIVCREGF